MKSTKYNKWKLSKRLFPTYEVKGDRLHNRAGANMIGRIAAAAKLSESLGRTRVDAMIQTDTKTEWVFAEPKRS